MDIKVLLRGVEATMGELQTQKVGNDHSAINGFQDKLCNWLKQEATTHKWKKEKKTTARKYNDSIDIHGKHNNGNNECDWIIEIDATRADQVAKKMQSRFALWGLKKEKPITYVAILYPDTQEGRNPSKKYIRYGYKIIYEINQKSKVYGIILGNDRNKRDMLASNYEDIVDEEIIELYDPSEDVHCNISCNGNQLLKEKYMGICAQKAILLYISGNNNKSFQDLKNIFKTYISNKKGNSNYKESNVKVSGETIYTYTQFRSDSNWKEFVKLCGKNGITIKELVKRYKNGVLNYSEED